MSALIYQFIAPRHFNEYTLTKEDYTRAAVLFIAVLVAVTLLGVVFLGKDRKRFAWLISLMNSGLLLIVGAIFTTIRLSEHPELLLQQYMEVTVFHSLNNYCALVCLWFALANIFDLAVGSVFYPKYVGFLTGWVHHSAFIWIMYACTSGNTPWGPVRPFSSLFLFHCIEELPTFLLALGSMFPSLRSDLGFGVTFFLFRILLHLYMFVYLYRLQCDTIVTVIFFLTTLLHLNWFGTWVTKYGKSFFGGAKDKKKDDKAH